MKIEYQNDTLTLFIPRPRSFARWSSEMNQDLEYFNALQKEEKIISVLTEQIDKYMEMGIDYFGWIVYNIIQWIVMIG